MRAANQFADVTTGVVYIHASPAAVCPHVEWALSSTLNSRANLKWTPQPAMPGQLRAVTNWVGPVGTGAQLANALRSWSVLRFITGACLCGLYMVMESWINERSSQEHRGRILSVYQIVNLGAVTAGNRGAYELIQGVGREEEDHHPRVEDEDGTPTAAPCDAERDGDAGRWRHALRRHPHHQVRLVYCDALPSAGAHRREYVGARHCIRLRR